MKCDSERLVALVLDDLEGEKRAAVESHVAGCPSCARRIAQLRRTLDVIGALPEAESRPVAMDRLRAEIAKAEAYAEQPHSILPRRPVRRWRWAFPMAAAAALAVACLHYGVAVRVGQFEIALGGKGGAIVVSSAKPTTTQAATTTGENAMRDLARKEIAAEVVPALVRLARTIEDLDAQHHEDLVGLRNAVAIQRDADLDEVKRNFGLIANTVSERLGVR
jgi:anti-sigma factor RsiW